MASYILALDQGTTSSRAILFDQRAEHRRHLAEGIHPALSPGGLGGARPDGDLLLPVRGDDGGHRTERGGAPARSRPSASPTSARPPSSGTKRPAGRSTTPLSGSAAGRPTWWTSCEGQGLEDYIRETTGLMPDAYFSAHQDQLDSRHMCRGRTGAGPAGRNSVRHGGQLADLEADRRQGARHRLHQRLPHHALQHPHPRLGRHAAGGAGHSALHAAAGDATPARSTATPPSRGRAMPIAGIAGDQQAALFGQACFEKGRGQKHLRHRLLFADEHRRDALSSARTVCSPPSPSAWTARCSTRWRAASLWAER